MIHCIDILQEHSKRQIFGIMMFGVKIYFAPQMKFPTKLKNVHAFSMSICARSSSLKNFLNVLKFVYVAQIYNRMFRIENYTCKTYSARNKTRVPQMCKSIFAIKMHQEMFFYIVPCAYKEHE